LIRMMVDADLERLSRSPATPVGVESRETQN
jgi:hypothetical protein